MSDTCGTISRAFLLVAVAAVGLCSAGCSGELDPSEPGEAYLMYRKALLEGDLDKTWKRSAESTHAYFKRRYEMLVEMDRKIHEYLPQSDHKLARKQTGAELLDEIEGPRGLFERIVRPDRLQVDQARRLGSLVGEIRKSKDKKKAEVVTRGGRTYRLIKSKKGEWHVALEDSLKALDESFQWLDRNDKALTKTINDLRKAEQQRREKIIAELMDVD